MKKLFLAIAAVMCLASCAPTKESAIKDLESLYNEVSAHAEQYETEDWEKFVVEYQKADSLINAHMEEYSDEELQQIGRIKGKCAAYMVKAAASEGTKQLRKATEQVKGMIDGFMDGMSNDK